MKRQMMKICVMVSMFVLNFVAEAIQGDGVDSCEEKLNDIVSDIVGGENVSRKRVSDVCYEIYKNGKKERAVKLLSGFGDKLLLLNLSNLGFRDRARTIENIGNIYRSVWGNIPVGTDKERWTIRLKGLAWSKKQLDLILASPPEDNRPWPEKWRNPRAPYDSEKGQWDEIASRLKSRFYRSDLRICVQDAESDRYSDEFRAWCFKEIEKIIGRPLTDDDIMFKADVLRRRAKRLIDRIPSSWDESTEAFTNVAHKACEAIRRIENPTNRLECAKAYAESLLGLDKFVRECDVQGYWARLAAYSNIDRLLKNIDIESRWIIAARYRVAMREELKEIDPLGSSTPMRLLRKNKWNEKEYDALVKENKKRRVALEYRYYANQIRGCLNNLYKPIFEHSLKEDCINLTPERKKALLKMVIDITGETPKWYKKEMDEAAAGRKAGK